MKTISVCMATYNGEKFIAQQLHSIFNQSLKPNQLIIFDDCSCDQTIEIIKRVTKNFDFEVKININDSKLGVVKNFEKAISNSSSDIIVLADQDDLWDSNRLHHVLSIFNNKEIDYYFSDSKIIDSYGNIQPDSLWKRRSFRKKLVNNFNKNQLPVLLKYENFIYGMTLAFKSNVLNAVIPIDSKSSFLTHDAWIPMILSGLNYKGYADCYSTTYYREHTDQEAGPGKNISLVSKFIFSLKNRRLHDNDLQCDFDKIAERISNFKNLSNCNYKFSKHFKNKASHLRFRANLGELSFFDRLRNIIREVVSGNYNKYSSSKLASIRDLIN